MRSVVRSAVKVWLVLLVMLAGPALGLAQSQTQKSVPQQAAPQQSAPQQAAPQQADTSAQETGSGAAQQPAANTQQAAPAPEAVPVAPLSPGVMEAAAKARRQVPQFTSQMEELEQRLSNPSLPRNELSQLRVDIEDVREQARLADAELDAPLSQIKDQISRLGPAPAEGESEADSMAAQRAQLNKALDELAGARAQLALVSGSIGQMADLAAQIERSRFLNTLLGKAKSIANPLLWTDGLAQLPALVERTTTLLTGFGERLSQERGAWAVWLVFGSLLILVAATVSVCRIIARRARHGKPGEHEFQKYLRTVMVPIGYTVVAAAAVFVFNIIFQSVSPDTPRMLRLVESLGVALVSFAFARGVARSILSPTRPEWRVVPLDSGTAAEWLWLSTLGFGLIGLNTFRKTLSDVINLAPSFDVASNAAVALMLVLIAARLILVTRHEAKEDGPHEALLKAGFSWASYLVQPVWLLLIATLIALLLGYVQLGTYISANIFIIGAVVSLLYCIRRLSDAFVAQSLRPRSRISRMLKSAFSMSDKGINRAGIAMNAGVDLALLLLGLPLVLGLTALTWVDVRSWLTTAFFGFKVGDITISPSSILLAVVVFTVGLALTRIVTGWLDRRILTPTEMDAGVRNSLRTASGYLAVIVVLLLAFAAAGVDFSNIAIVAGALSVGIGFGLQSIVNNFVSGLILLAERPIKVGDWVQVTGGEGTVRKINVRSTEIETFDRCSIIVPNSSLISDTVSNWTHGDLIGRVRVGIGVSYDADPKQVEEILIKCAEAHPRALQFPAVTVLFKEFGASSLDFEVRVFIDDVGWVAFVASDLRFEIYKALKEACIEIPFPQRDVNVRGLKDAVKESVEEAVAGKTLSKTLSKPRKKQVKQRRTIGEFDDGSADD